MLKFLFILAAIVSLSLGADHDVFKDCSRVPFCQNLRTRAPTDKYHVHENTISFDLDSGLVEFEVNPNDDSDVIAFQIYALKDQTFRIKAYNIGAERYNLQDVLNGEPQIAENIETHRTDDDLTITVGSSSAKIIYTPFKIEFTLNDILEVVFDGSQLNYEKSLDQAFTFGVSYPEALQLYGIHEHCDGLALKTTKDSDMDPYRLMNADNAGYELNSPMALYGSIPVLYAHGPGATSGIFSHNAAENWVEITNGQDSTNSYFMVESGMLDLFVLLGPTPLYVIQQYMTLTGTAHLPQLWTLGHHQCRWSYMSQDEVKDVVANFVNYNFPLDVIWLDIDYTDGKKYFTWNPETFSDPIELQQNISAVNKRLVTIIDPHIKVEQGYNVYDGALEKDLFVKKSDGSNFEGDCWPGLSSYMDFLNPEARDYIANFYSYENFQNSTPTLSGIWNDMNEPSVFDNSLEKTLPKDAVHVGGVQHRDIHNIYGFLQTRSTHEGLMQRDNGTKRPFILSRSHFAGTQRYSAIWTGDNEAEWGHLKISYAMCLNANILGIVFCGADVGGFAQNPSEELLQRWYQAGAWLPFYRAHAAQGTDRREPYLFSDEVQKVIRDAIELRYRHIPTWYTLFYEHTRNLYPIIRPLFYQYRNDTDVYTIDDQLLVGSYIMAKVVADEGAESVQVYFPGGENELWYSVHDGGEIYNGNGWMEIPVTIAQSPVYYRGGSVVVTKESKLSTDEMMSDGYVVYANADIGGRALGTVYIDDFTSFDYIEQKRFTFLGIELTGTDVVVLPIDPDANSDGFDFKIDKLIVNQVTEMPSKGKAGKYETIIYERASNGQLLKDLDLKINTTFSLK